jgi:hypothetical protein
VVNGIKLSAKYREIIDAPNYHRDRTEEESSINGYKMAALVGVGIAAPLPAKLQLRVAPAFQYDILASGTERTKNKTYLWNAGLNCSLIHRF